MSRTFGLSLLATAVAFGLTVMAQERPTQEHQDIMKSNAAILAVTGLRAHVTAKDYDAILTDATTLKANFEKIGAFWTPRKVDDAIKFAKAGVKAAIDLETAAKAKDDAALEQVQRAFAPLCRDCHQVHRLYIPTESRYEIK